MDPFLTYSIIKTESGYDPMAESSAGARGLMQMTEDTFAWIKSKIAKDEQLDFNSLYEPETSIRFGVYFISISLEKYDNDVSTAAAAYHSGWGTVDKLLTQEENSKDGKTLYHFPYNQMNYYVHKINKNYDKYKELYSEQTGNK